MKLVKDSKVVKLRPVRGDVNKIIRNLGNDRSLFQNLIVFGQTKEGDVRYYTSKVTNAKCLYLIRQFQRHIEGQVYD